MLLAHPTIQEIKNAELSTLLDMLVELTKTYTKMIAKKGFSPQSEVFRQILINLQSAIQIRRNIKDNEKNRSPR